MEFNHYNSNSLNQSTVERKERRRVVEIGICRVEKGMQGRKGEGRKREGKEKGRKGDARKEREGKEKEKNGRKREGITSWDKYQQGVKNKLL